MVSRNLTSKSSCLARSLFSLLLDSTFTLCPAGHNPECYRMYEAAEAGSIPIVPLDETCVISSF